MIIQVVKRCGGQTRGAGARIGVSQREPASGRLERIANRRDHHGIGRGGTGYRGVFVGIMGVKSKDLHAKQR